MAGVEVRAAPTMKRWLLLALGIGAVLGAATAYDISAREREYRRLIGEGETALAADRGDQAIEAFSGAIALRPTSMLGHLKRGETYWQRGDHVAALRDLRTAITLDPANPRPVELLGDVNYALKRFARAAERYRAYAEMDDRSPRVLYKLGLARFRFGDISGAIPALRQAVTLEPDLAEAQYILGLCLRERGQIDEARAALGRALDARPQFLDVRDELVSLERSQGQTGKALTQLEALVAVDPRPERQVALGVAYAEARRTDLAVTAIGQAADGQPMHGPAYVDLGRVWLSAAEARSDHVSLNKAVEALRAAVAAGAVSSEGLTLLGRAYLLRSEWEEAEQMLRRAAATFPVDPKAFLYLADVAEHRSDLTGARDALMRHEALVEPSARPKNLPVRIGDLSLRLNAPREAATWYRRALGHSPNDVTVLARLADAEWRAGSVDAARVIYRQAVALNPSHPALRSLHGRLSPP